MAAGRAGRPTDSRSGAITSACDSPAQSTPTPAVPHLVTEVIRVEFVPVSTLVEPLRLFMTEGGVIMPYDRQTC